MKIWIVALFICTLFAATSVVQGAPTNKHKKGSSFSLVYKQDFLRNIAGGKSQGGAAPGMIEVDWKYNSGGNRFVLGVLGTFGASLYKRIGAIQAPSDVNAYNTVKLYKLWYGYHFGDSGLALRLGKQDYSALFNTLKPAQIFLNTSFGVAPTIAQAHPSIYPTTALGAVLHWKGNGWYALGGVYDGVPGLPGHPAGTHVELRDGDGVFTDIEVGLVGKGYKVGVGGWYRTTEYNDILGDHHDRNHGLYVIGSLLLVGGDSQPSLHGFVQLGSAQEDRNKLARYIGAGLKLKHFISARPKDAMALGVARVYPSDLFERAKSVPTEPETVVELAYRFNLDKALFVQPDVQYIIDPGALASYDNAWVVGFRVDYKL